MPLDDRYVISPPLNQYFVDKTTGLPLSGGTITFYRDAARNILKDIYQLTGAPPNYTYTQLPNPLVLSSVGTPLNASNEEVQLYLYPFDADGNLDLYYIVCEDSNGGPQWVREATPNLTDSDNPESDMVPITNQITNSQFAQITLNEGFSTTYTVTGTELTFPVAPGWELVANGTGTIVLTRNAVPGNQNVVTNPPFVLDLDISNNISICYLRQRMFTNSGLWSSTADKDVYISGSFVAKSVIATTTQIEMFYRDSSGGIPISIVTGAIDNTSFENKSGTTTSKIPLSNNTSTGSNAYIDIYLSFQPGAHVQLTSIQVVPVNSFSAGARIDYDLNSTNMENSSLAYYYTPRLSYRPTQSLLTGWDFPLNPAQELPTKTVLAASAQYIWDQTIMQSNNLPCNVTRNNFDGGLRVETTGDVDSFYILQYLEGAQTKKLLGSRWSVNVNAYAGPTANNTVIRVYLYRAPATGAFPLLPLTIGTVTNNGLFVLSGAAVANGWTEIPRNGADTAKATLVKTTGPEIPNNSDYGFIGWEITDLAQIADTDKFAIVVTAEVPVVSSVIFSSISLIPGDIPCRPGPQTFDEVLRECMYYWEKSKNNDVALTSPGAEGSVFAVQVGQNLAAGFPYFHTDNFGFQFVVPKRKNPVCTLYAENGTINNVTQYTRNGNTATGPTNVAVAGNWTINSVGQKGVDYNAVFIGGSVPISNLIAGFTLNKISFHYSADARIGVV